MLVGHCLFVPESGEDHIPGAKTRSLCLYNVTNYETIGPPPPPYFHPPKRQNEAWDGLLSVICKTFMIVAKKGLCQ